MINHTKECFRFEINICNFYILAALKFPYAKNNSIVILLFYCLVVFI
jgi:hypothetical protein